LLLLSHTNAIHFEIVWENYPLLRHFDHRILSYQVGALTPSPLIYEEAMRHARCALEDCFFTGDIPTYVEAAGAAGIDAVQFEIRAQKERELKACGVVGRRAGGSIWQIPQKGATIKLGPERCSSRSGVAQLWA
jgi:glucose-1-phosphatase